MHANPCHTPSPTHLQLLAGAVAQVGQVDAAAVLADDELGASLPSRRVRARLHQRLQAAAAAAAAMTRQQHSSETSELILLCPWSCSLGASSTASTQSCCFLVADYSQLDYSQPGLGATETPLKPAAFQ
jgi:hypothetical protein